MYRQKYMHACMVASPSSAAYAAEQNTEQNTEQKRTEQNGTERNGTETQMKATVSKMHKKRERERERERERRDSVRPSRLRLPACARLKRIGSGSISQSID
jgi:hypothetical protein